MKNKKIHSIILQNIPENLYLYTCTLCIVQNINYEINRRFKSFILLEILYANLNKIKINDKITFEKSKKYSLKDKKKEVIKNYKIIHVPESLINSLINELNLNKISYALSPNLHNPHEIELCIDYKFFYKLNKKNIIE